MNTPGLILPTLPEEIPQGLAELEALFNLDPVLARLAEMLEEAQTAQLAGRFSPKKTAGYWAGGLRSQPHDINLLLEGPTETAYKRAQLIADLRGSRSDFTALFGRAQDIFLDLKIAQREG